MSSWVRFGLLLAAVALSQPRGAAAEAPGLFVSPPQVTLDSPEAAEQLLVTVRAADGSTGDVTREANYEASVAGLVSISSSGRVIPLRDGTAELRIRVGEQSARVKVQVTGMTAPPPVSFHRDVIPIFSKAGCNSGGCHGKAEGQNGFKLSVFGNDPAADHRAIVSDGRGRRVFPAAPHASLLLMKAASDLPHGGGQRIERTSRWHSILRRWIAEGAKLDEQTTDAIVSIAVEPAQVTLPALGSQQLRVTTVDSSGRQRCVTVEAEYQSNNDAIAVADRDGLIKATNVPGEAAILVRHLGHVAICRVTRPRPAGDFTRPAERNFVDRLVWDKLQQLRVAPSPLADDATFLRRAFIDTIGTLPTSDEARRFLADTAPDKRGKLVAALLDRTEYADYWAQRWADLLRVDKDTISPAGAVAMTRWIRRQFAGNVPYDQFVRSILTAQGSTLSESPAAFYQVQADPERLARSVSQLFLGVRIECAQCHHHPMEKWDQKDYFAFAGFFTGLDRKQVPGAPGAAGGPGSLKIIAKTGSDLPHPRSKKVVAAAGLGAAPAEFAAVADRRKVLAEWVTGPKNPYFAKMIVNRLWAHYFGRGLVEPIDDMRATNPASNEPLLNALAEHFVAVKYDIKAFTRTLLDSQVYQLSAVANESNQLDEQNYSRAAWKPLSAEVLLDAISQATGVPEEFNGWPRGYRAIQVWDNKLPSEFLEVFGRPRRQTVCSCERGSEPSMAQAMHLMNATGTTAKIEHRAGRAAALAGSTLTPDEILDDLYLATLSRFPTEAERKAMRQAFTDSSDRREAVEDILWALVNTKEFVFNH